MHLCMVSKRSVFLKSWTLPNLSLPQAFHSQSRSTQSPTSTSPLSPPPPSPSPGSLLYLISRQPPTTLIDPIKCLYVSRFCGKNKLVPDILPRDITTSLLYYYYWILTTPTYIFKRVQMRREPGSRARDLLFGHDKLSPVSEISSTIEQDVGIPSLGRLQHIVDRDLFEPPVVSS